MAKTDDNNSNNMFFRTMICFISPSQMPAIFNSALLVSAH